MLKRLTTFYKVSIILIIAIMMIGCVSPYKYFPEEPKWAVYNDPPIISYIESNNTYIVTSDLVDNAVKQRIYIDTIKVWRINNTVK